MKPIIICLIIFQTVVGKNFLVEVEDNPKKGNELSLDEKLEAELSTTLEDSSVDNEMLEDMEKAGNDYFHMAPSYARSEKGCRGENSLQSFHIQKTNTNTKHRSEELSNRRTAKIINNCKTFTILRRDEVTREK